MKAGYRDPLGSIYGTNDFGSHATAEKRINAYLNSWNGWQRKAPGDADHSAKGSYGEYILTTPMRTLVWETVANLDGSGNVVGVIPSDHFMLRADVVLP